MTLRRSTGFRNMILGKYVNLIPNPSFDNDPTHWTTSNATAVRITSGGVDDGSYMKVTGTSDTQPGVAYITSTVARNTVYLVTLYAKNLTTGKTANFKIELGGDVIYSRDFSDSSWTKLNWAVFTGDQTELTIRVTTETPSNTAVGVDEVLLANVYGSFRDIFKNACIRIYTGTQPASANNAPSGTLLVTITDNNTPNAPLKFGEASGGTLTKDPNAVWSGAAVATGTAGWFRLSPLDDAGATDTVTPRIDGAVGTSGAELNMSSTSIVSGAVQTIVSFNVSMTE